MKTAIRIAQFILIFCIILSCVTIAYADVDTAHNIIASAEPTEPVASEFVMMEELFTSTIEHIDGVTMYAPEESQELTPPIAIMKPDVSVEMPTEPEPLAPPIAPEHKCCGATVYYPATCTQDGYYESVCDCGNTYREEFPATGHDWGDWHTTKLMTFTPGSMLRECKNCGMKEGEMFMDKVNSISIPSLRLNSTFLNTAEGGIGNSDFVYYTHANRSIITGDMNLEKMNPGDAIYLNTNAGLVIYRVEVSEFGASDGANIIGQTSNTSIWDAQYENDLCLYAPCEGGYWMVIASVFEA